MDLGKFFGTIGADATNIWNGLFNGNQQKKKQQQPSQPSQPMSLPSSQPTVVGTLQQPQSLIPAGDLNQAPQIGGVTHMQSAQPKPSNPFDDFVHGAEGWAGDAARNIGDFAGSANNAAARTLVGGAANAVNLFKDGFDTNKTNQDTNDFLNSVGLGEKSHSGLNKNVNYDSTAGKIGGAYGNVEGGLNPVTPVLGGVEGLGSIAGATLAQNNLLNKGYDPNQVLEASDTYTSPYGVSSKQSDAQNALGVGGNALQLALGLAGADSLVPKFGERPKVAFAPHPTDVPSVAPSQLDHIVQALKGDATGESEALPISSTLNEADNLVKPPLPPAELPPIEEGPITTPKTPTTPSEPAITTPSTPKPVQPQPVLPTPAEPPVLGGTKLLAAQTTPAPVQAPVTPAVEQAVKDAIEKDATKAPEAPAPVETAPAEAPSTKAAKAAATETPPPAAVEQALAEGEKAQVPDYTSPVKNNKTASVAGPNSAKYTTGNPKLDDIVHDSIVSHKGTAKTAGDRADALTEAGISSRKQTAIRNIAVNMVDKSTGQISKEGVDEINRILTSPERTEVATGPVRTLHEMPSGDVPPVDEPAPTSTAPDAAPVGKLGTITRQAVHDGSINTPEGVAKAVADTRTAANNEAEAAGDSLSNIIKKGQSIWGQSNTAKHDLTESEVLNGYSKGKVSVKGDPSFTPAQQQVYKDYMQEIATLRDRAGYSLNGGHQGAWYGPRQALDATGESAEFNPKMVNEISRNRDQVGHGVANDVLDTSEAPIEHAIQRYANAPDAMSQQLVDRVENDAKGNPTGIKVPDTAKEKLNNTLSDVISTRDAAAKAAHEGDIKTANNLKTEAESGINKAFTEFIDDIPKGVTGRGQAINEVKAMRDTYRQSFMQVLSLSNVVNRVADQGGKLLATVKQPVEHLLSKVIDPVMGVHAGAESVATNTSKEMYQAARQVAKGELGRQIGNNFKASMSLAGAGRNPLMKGIAKLGELPSAINSAATEGGDLATQNLKDALQLGASRPEAAGIKTVADYKKYFGDYMQTSKFKDDLAEAERRNNTQIGLSGGKGDNMASGGTISTSVSRNLDNGFKNHIAPRIGLNPEGAISRNVNDYIKGNVTGYAGVGSRLLGYTKDSVYPISKWKQAVELAKSGSPNARAAATQMAAKQVASSLATYGSAGAAYEALSAGPLKGIIGYTGPQAQMGSSDASANKGSNVPANQWYVNIGGKRIYFNATRTFNAPGLVADTVAGAMTSKDPGTAFGNSATQIYNQAGGSSLPNTIVNGTTLANPAESAQNKKYAGEQLQQTAAPSTGILNNIANWTDPTKRAPTNFVDDLKSNIPVLRSQTPVAKDSRGNDIPNSKQLSGGSSVFSVGTNTDSPKVQAADPVGTEINRLQGITGSVFPTATNTNAKTTKNTQEFAGTLLNDPIYTSADDAGRADMMKKVLAGSLTKGINDSVSPTDKQALLDHLLLGKDQAATWMQDNDNALNYLTAKYNNDSANNTLTTPQKDINYTGSLAQQIAIAHVNKDNNVTQDLINSYHDTKKAEFNALEDGSDEKDQLLAYDQALVKAGLPSKYQNKYGGYGSTGKGAGGTGKNFTFASLPSSLFGVNSSGNNKLPGYDTSGVPLFKPVADLVAPPTVAPIPKGRTISASPGVKL